MLCQQKPQSPRRLGHVLLAVLIACAATAARAEAQTGGIAGVVTNAANASPLAGVRVWAASVGAAVGTSSVLTDAGGAYSITGLGAGQYTVYTQNSAGYVDEIFDNNPCIGACDLATGTAVTVSAGVVSGGRDFALTLGGVVTGAVTNAAGGGPIVGATVFATATIGGATISRSAQTNGSGAYSINGLPTGSYALITSNTLGFVNEVWDNVPCVGGCSADDGSKVAVVAGAVAAGENFALDLGGQITGVVSNAATSLPVANVTVQATRLDGSRYSVSAQTNASGAYVIKGLAAGAYALSTQNSLGFINEIYDNIGCISFCGPDDIVAQAPPVSVVLGGTASGKDFQLDPGGTIAGTVSDAATGAGLANVGVGAYVSVNGVPRFVGAGFTTTNGAYSIVGLSAGQYFMYSSANGYVNAIFGGVTCPGACLPTTAIGSGTPVPVTQGATASGRNLSLTRGGSISGVVTDAANGTPLSSINVSAFMRVRGQVVRTSFASTDSGGRFTLGGLPSGTYEVFTNTRGAYANRFFGGTSCVGDCVDLAAIVAGAPIVVIQGVDTPGRNIQLDRGGTIAGVMTDATTGQPLRNTEVEIFTVVAGRYSQVDSVVTNASGAYATHGLPAGNYYAAAAARDYPPTIYPNATCWSLDDCLAQAGNGAATPIPVAVGATTAGRDFALSPAGSVAGVVTDGGSGQPLVGIELRLLRLVNGKALPLSDDATVTDSQGRYRFTGLLPGSYVAYTVSRRAFTDSVYAGAACNGDCTAAFAAAAGLPIAVGPGAVTSGINFALAPRLAPGPPTSLRAVGPGGGSVSFTWTAPLAAYGGLATSYVFEAGFAPGTVAITVPTPSPSFSATGVPPGTYYIRVRGVNASGVGPASSELVLTMLPNGFQSLRAPRNATGFVAGPPGAPAQLTFTWGAPLDGAAPSAYVLEVGMRTGLSNLANLFTPTTSFSYPAVPPGVYFLRARATAAGTTSPASDETMLVVGGVPAPPDPPVNFTAIANGGNVTLRWYTPAIGSPTGYLLEIGSASGLTDLGSIPLFGTSFSAGGVPPGRYYLRLRSVNFIGLSITSPEVVLDVP